MPDAENILESRPTSGPGSALQKFLIERLAVDENVPSGILHRCSVSSSRIREYAAAADSPICSQVEFEELYGEIAFSYHHGAELLSALAVADRAKLYTDRGLTPVFLADFNMEIVRPRFWAAAENHLSAGLDADSSRPARPLGEVFSRSDSRKSASRVRVGVRKNGVRSYLRSAARPSRPDGIFRFPARRVSLQQRQADCGNPGRLRRWRRCAGCSV